jgi:prevent-host-death family protein
MSSDTCTVTMVEARNRLGTLVRRAAASNEQTVITDHGHPAAVLISARELAELRERIVDLEAEAAIARQRQAEAEGTAVYVPQAEARRRLGLA